MAEQEKPESIPDNTQEMLVGIVNQAEDLVRLLIDGESREMKDNLSFAEIHKQLQVLKMTVEQLDFFSQNLVTNLEKEGIVVKTEEVPHSQKRLIERLEKISEVCEKEKSELYQSLQEHKQEVKAVIENEMDDSKTKSRKRKGRMKGIGAKRNWIPS